MIVSDPNIMMGKPAIAGTRLTVELIVNRLAAGESVEQLLEGYPNLTREGIKECLEYAAKQQQKPTPA